MLKKPHISGTISHIYLSPFSFNVFFGTNKTDYIESVYCIRLNSLSGKCLDVEFLNGITTINSNLTTIFDIYEMLCDLKKRKTTEICFISNSTYIWAICLRPHPVVKSSAINFHFLNG